MTKIILTKEQEEALMASVWARETLEESVQFFFDDHMGVIVQNFNGKKVENLAKFLLENPLVAEEIKTKHNLDSSFKLVITENQADAGII